MYSADKRRRNSAADRNTAPRAARELGIQQGLLIPEKERLSAEYAHATAEVQNRSSQLHSRVEEAHNDLSVRESDIAVAGSLLAERECALA
ncbi:hypothetical protein TcBrA4_0006500 [Trypanosoma cruzi]|nr:hypothetical protein TcBrA4_0006500 [Trypanosoma cruzi]